MSAPVVDPKTLEDDDVLIAPAPTPKTAYFSALASSYAAQTGNSTRDLFALLLEDIECILPVAAGSKVHDNAAGPGVATSVLLSRLPAASLASTDILVTDNVPAMVTAARDLLSPLLTECTITVSEMDSQSLTAIPDESFTHSILNFSIFVMDEPLKCLQEIYRTTAVGGLAVLTTWKRFGVGEVVRAAQAKVRPDLPAMPIAKEIFTREGHLAGLAAEAGFEESKMKVVSRKIAVKEADLEGLRAFTLGPFMEPARKGWTTEEASRWAQAVDEALEEEAARDGGMVFESWAVLATK
jgi:ubiquinone/menaquinone biosynthesis C-methylase UbiE